VLSKKYVLPAFAAIALALPLAASAIWQPRQTRPEPTVLTPDNAIEILFKHVKQANYKPLLEFTTGPEEKRIQTLLAKLGSDRTTAHLVRRQAHELDSYRIYRQEIHTNVAAIMFAWRYKRTVPPSRVSGRPSQILVEEGCEALLIRTRSAWKIASVRSWVPDEQRGNSFLQQQVTNKRKR